MGRQRVWSDQQALKRRSFGILAPWDENSSFENVTSNRKLDKFDQFNSVNDYMHGSMLNTVQKNPGCPQNPVIRAPFPNVPIE